MTEYVSPEEESAKVAYLAGASLLFLALAIGAWLIFANLFDEGFSTNCGDGCTTTVDQTLGVRVMLGLAVLCTVASATTAVMAHVRSLHNRQVALLRRVAERSS